GGGTGRSRRTALRLRPGSVHRPAPGNGRLTLLRTAVRKGAYTGVRPAAAETLATAAGDSLFGYALTGPATSP
ncbi:hypothetical protein ACWDS7_04980, partial [Streptosporangium sp. NPDC003464]